MEIHRYEKLWLVASLLLIVAFIATVTYGALGVGVKMVGDEGGQVDAANPTASDNFRQPGVYQAGENEYDVYVIARQFAFQPGSTNPIRVPAGSTVTFYITSGDVVHGFEVVGTNVNVMAIPGQVAKITVQFDDSATYGIVCNEYCGSGHHTMSGQLIVVPKSQYQGGASA
ncbi:MAG: cytochrome c oxidase subunit II [Haloferacaceae archaeon]